MDKDNLFQLAESIRKDEQMIRFDLSKPQLREYFLAEMGGEKELQEQFPQLYQQYLEAVNGQSDVQVGEPDAFQDAVDLFYGFYNKDTGKIICKGVTSIKHEAVHICQRIHVYDDSGNLIVASGKVVPNTKHAVYELEFPCQLNTSSLIFDYFSLWYSPEDGLQMGMYSSKDELVWTASDYVKEVTMLNPIHIRTQEDSPIVVCYNRIPSTKDTVDYIYEEAFDPKEHVQNLYLDVGAKVQTTADAGDFSTVDITKLLLKLDCQSGIAIYSKEGRVNEIIKSFIKETDGFNFRLDKDWKGVVPSARLPQKEPVDFMMRVEFLTDNNKKRGRFIVDSQANTESTAGYVKAISRIHLLWGCVALDTPILMADGRQQRANEVRVGDVVQLEDGCGMVRDVFRGRELKPLICIETENGRRICCSSEHPIMTRNGYRMADEITGMDQLRDVVEGFVAVRMVYTVDPADVVNFDIQPMNPANKSCVICDWLVTGDMEEQYRCIRRMQKEKEEKQNKKQVSDETMKLFAFFEETV